MWTYITYDELYHHGIKGQKWGKRNYQYEDGSLTPEGKARYGVGSVRGHRTNVKNYRSRATLKSSGADRAANEEFDRRISEYHRRQGTGKTIAKNLLFGSMGSMTYNMARASGEGRGKAALRAIFDLNATTPLDVLTAIPSDPTDSNEVRKANAFNFARRVASDAIGRAVKNTGGEVSLQQRAIRNKATAQIRSKQYEKEEQDVIDSINKKWEKKFEGYKDWSKSPDYDDYVNSVNQEFIDEMRKRGLIE